MRSLSWLMAAVMVPLAFFVAPRTPFLAVLEAENPAELRPPMRMLREKEASGGMAVELPPGCGQGWRGLGAGSATYRVDVPREGLYRFWARVLWRDGCTNAFFLQANDEPRVVFGNDAVFNEWHWVKGQQLRLREGVNYITFANHSDGTALDKIVCTDDPLYAPEGLGDDISVFYDGFAGCDADNTGSWEFPTGRWRVVRGIGESAAGANDCLAQWDPKGGSAFAGFPSWHDYDARALVMLTAPGTVTLVFCRRDAEHEARLVWDAGNARLRLERVERGRAQVLGEAETAAWVPDRWYELGFRKNGDRLIAGVDEAAQLDVPWHGTFAGQVGLTVQNGGGAFFDNVEVRFRR